MTTSDVAILAAQAATFACGMALLSYKFFAVYRERFAEQFSYKSHIPGVTGTALMLLAILSAASSGWMAVGAVVLVGYALSPLCVYLFRSRIEAALLGPVLAALIFVA